MTQMAWRNLWRHARRTWLTVLGMAFGILLSVVLTGMAAGTYGGMIDYAADLGSGHVSIEHQEFRARPQPAHHVRVAPEVIEELRANNGVRHVLPRISTAALLSTARGNSGAAVLGIDPAQETTTSLPILEALNLPEGTEPALRQGSVWVGATLLENLDATVGQKVVLTFSDQAGDVVTRLARVAGTLETGAPTVDGGLALLPIEDLREGLGFEASAVTYEVIALEDYRDAEAVARRLNRRLSSPQVALPWYEAQPELASFIAVDGSTLIVIQFIVLLLLGAGVFNTIFVGVVERRREFGILRAIGFSRAQIFQLVITESAWLAILGIFAGALVTVGPYLHLHAHGIDMSSMIQPGTEVAGVAMKPILSVRIYPVQVVRLVVIVIVATLTAGLPPAWSACKRSPAAVLRG